MNSSYCYIDYSKNKKALISQSNVCEVMINNRYADIYFSIPKDSKSFKLLETDRYVFLFHGSVDVYDDSLESLIMKDMDIDLQIILKKVEIPISLSIYDKERELIYLSCDHFGVIPNYYYKSSDIIIFSNSMKSFKNSSRFSKNIDFNMLGQYLQYGYILQPNTMFLDCFRVKSAHFITIDISTMEIEETRYWDIFEFYNKPKIDMDEEEIIKRCEGLLKSAIYKRLKGSKRVGAFLSGGYDSSTIVSILSLNRDIELYTFTMGFEDLDIDEAPYAKKISKYLNLKHNEHYFDPNELEGLLFDFVKIYDQPIADKAAIPTILICKEASSLSIDILFGGEGGDEIFASSSLLKRLKQIDSIPYHLRFIISKILKLFSFDIRFYKYSKILKQKEIANILKYEGIMLNFKDVKKLLLSPIDERLMEFTDITMNRSIDPLDKIFPMIIKSYVQDNLLPKIYYANQAYKITPKIPYLDREFVEFMATVNIKYKHKEKTNKYILRKIVEQYIPLKLIDRPKKGFSVPVGKILKTESRSFLDKYINYDRIKSESIFNPDEVMRLKNRFLNSDSYYDEQIIWSILIFELWYEDWFSK